MPLLSRTTSAESAPLHLISKARASEPQAGTESIEVKLSPLGTAALAPLRPVGLNARRPSRASESLKDYHDRNSTATNATTNTTTPNTTINTNAAAASSAIIDEDSDASATTPLAPSRYPSSLSEARSWSDVDAAENRLSFSSLYSFGSAIYANTRGHSWSARSSLVGSEPDGETSFYSD